ncbi:MAG: DNA starvation/stationary phase protection protein [Ignavibacteriales bacterium]|jgi:DNA-binding ferritin-like protein (oxidative damage protectant)|nr:MAG: DNA starvation/stationary phase protection protein [Ignavibacteriaceae bacterium]MBW7874154.1 DNA starvation/stationary phase protection protein [Ignavibacteria bacterium]MCZ2142929.1 DNA starvation/stationary phase protection protein [Ignavibacteriales bacterium]MBV6444517.1 DNA protection during starvation protein [Ignavibacteriaceae bacterium]MBZ0197906.1 DNA starvation/stationary phase protection protein [Ignavibacteriaceae bacterium]
MSQANARIAALLTDILADQHVIYMKARNYHWNITGPHFFALHTKFEEIYTLFADQIDEVAERIRTFGEKVPGTMVELVNKSSLTEDPDVNGSESKMAGNLADDLSKLAAKMEKSAMEMQNEFQDEVTAGMLYGYAQGFEKDVWMLKSFLA